MNINEYNKIKNLNYDEYCNYLKEKYGEAKVDYLTPSLKKNNKISRTKEGLFCHHIKEDSSILLCDPRMASEAPIEYQKKENLCYCDYLEHLLLHILICEKRGKDVTYDEDHWPVGIGGIEAYLVPKLNDIYSGWNTPLAWEIPCVNKIKEDKDVYLTLIKRFKDNCSEYPRYEERYLYMSASMFENNENLFEEIKNL